ncbi:hypothetical protein ACQKGC_29210, partial [Allorhizobium pseudoryzae]
RTKAIHLESRPGRHHCRSQAWAPNVGINPLAIAADEQRETIAEVNAAVAGLDQVTQQNAALVDSNKAEAERLEEQAARLNGLVKTFRLPTSGDFSTETRQRVTLIA